MSDAHKTRVLPAGGDANKTVMGAPPTVEATQTIKPTQCPICKTFNPAGVMFCVDCGLIFDRALPPDAFGAPAVQLPVLVDSSGREHPLRPGVTAVGREGDLALADPRVSRRHASVRNDNGEISVEDLGSTNGVKVDGRPAPPGERVRLTGGEKISFGGVELQLSLPGASKGSATQAFAGNKTAAVSAPPRKETAPAALVGGGRELPLRSGTNTFGRKAENDVVLPDPYVSGRHGQIDVTDSGVFLTDLGSSNGTMLNEAKLAPNMRTQVTPDDVIRLGSLELRVVLSPGPSG